MTGRAIVFFDGDCSFCTATVRRFAALDQLSRLEFRNIRNPEIFRRYPEIDRERALARMQLLPPGSSTPLEGFHAFRWMAARLPAFWIAVPFLWLPGVSSIGQRIYDRVASTRSCTHGPRERST
jgi:predicted DCC family thiol-disulfide oxidoreductase YuxK